MSALVSYVSSGGEDEDDDIQPEKPAKTRSLTLPPIPNFHIPSSPSPPPPNTETSTTLATTTNKLTHFLELKNQGVHFNARLETSVSLRNPGLLPKLMEFAGMTREEGYGSTVSVGSWSESEGGVEGGGKGGVPGKWREEWYVEGLVKENERRERQRMAGRGEVEFVPAAAGAVKSVGDLGASGATGTTAGGGGGGGGREGGKRSRFDKR
ncbi:hypothetical protein B0A55_13199 [Friedmanniomyces simplex]|uniref:HCNGP-like protein n=1 Tax=Friedmanniomyces simplex TaxID=329884 RepID=A0A4U0W228_9PEZI|nr:hypothetical protein B0A55_13199 [Friedmanniomyces simplex]